MSGQVEDKKGNPINDGDRVSIKIRGGKREGEVDEIVMSDEEAQEKSVKNPPKGMADDLCFIQCRADNQHGHNVAHNPEAVENLHARKWDF
ncbi:hypothetical protein K432DRAFT_312880 [Lepidopterella palustris CBS 459.81]|uniref:Hypervirulence associated protein TUDOR domain-containing protein n=1 Tax=Lepidopterella palustris CBS 459.81 TaxID=1314670 RepID=A0A8E2DX69_9PEZI|nr:hypothetical protein K432DRAFT_312880 [Lepidopterella palustris CBS 459.81]